MGDRRGPLWQRLLRRHRRLLAGTAAGMSIATLGMALQPTPAQTRPVVVAATDLPAGQHLTPDDLRVAHVPADVLPASTYNDPAELIGEVLIAPLTGGEAVGRHRLTTPPAWALPPGTLPVPVRFADARAAELLSAGTRIDVLAPRTSQFEGAGSGPADLIATDVQVLTVLQPDSGDAGMLGTPAVAGESSALVVLAADRTSALAIAGSSTQGNLTFLMRPGAAG